MVFGILYSVHPVQFMFIFKHKLSFFGIILQFSELYVLNES